MKLRSEKKAAMKAAFLWESCRRAGLRCRKIIEEFLAGQIEFTTELCAKAENAEIKIAEGLHKCPRCQKGFMIKRKGKNGEFWGCSNFPRCKMTCNDKDGKPDFEGKKNFAENKTFKDKDFYEKKFFDQIISSADF